MQLDLGSEYAIFDAKNLSYEDEVLSIRDISHHITQSIDLNGKLKSDFCKPQTLVIGIRFKKLLVKL